MALTLTPCQSSQLAAWGYDETSQTLAVQFHNGGTWHYSDVPAETAQAMREAESVGKFFSSTVRGKFAAAKQEPPKADEA